MIWSDWGGIGGDWWRERGGKSEVLKFSGRGLLGALSGKPDI